MTGHLELVRVGDWEARLNALLAQRRDVLFTWGATDCCMFAADAVLAMTGVDAAAEFRGRYTTAGGAARALKRHGAGELAATIDAKFESVAPAFVRRGDLVAVDHDALGTAIGVCIGADAVFVGLEAGEDGDTPGLVRVPRAGWRSGWRVG